jgi:predicted histidine transporter YuiF (NhaC family)
MGDIEQETDRLKKRIKDMEFVEMVREEEERQKKESNKVKIGMCIVCGILPMTVGIFTNNSEMAFGGAGFMVLFFVGVVWWKWYSR